MLKEAITNFEENEEPMKKVLIVVASLSLIAFSAMAEEDGHDLNPNMGKAQIGTRVHQFQDGFQAEVAVENAPLPLFDAVQNDAGTPGGSGQLVNHGGGVMPFAHVVCIFWGSALPSTSSYVAEMRQFRNSASGMVKHTSMLGQYGASQSNFVGSQADVFDSTNPSSAAVTDAMVQNEVKKWFTGKYDTNAVYEVFIPSGYYSKDGSSTSCGGPHLAYCAYHSSGNGTNLPTNVKYSIEPYPSCSGCAVSGWNTNQNAEHFMVHETRETVTDPYGSSWYDAAGYEADDKCAWVGLFLETAADGHTYGYQPEYSNSGRACVN